MHLLKMTLVGVTSALLLSAGTAVAGSYSSGGASFSAYLVGYFDVEDPVEAEVVLVNPTPYYLVALVAFFDDDQNAIGCEHVELSPNDLEDVDIDFDVEDGVVKVVSFGKEEYGDEEGPNVMAGLVGWVAHENDDSEEDPSINTALVPVPESLLWARRSYELKKIYRACKEVD